MPSPDNASRILKFGVFEIDLKSGELRKSGLRKRLQPQPFKVLSLLAQRAGEAITREELQKHVWDDDTHVDFEHGLNYCVRQVRTALGDNADSPRYVETLPRVGYRFIAEVHPVVPAGQEPEPASAPPGPAPHRRFWTPAALLALAAVMLASLLLWQQTAPRVESSSDRMRLAVLPFQPLGPQPVDDHVLAGMTEDLILNLSRHQQEHSLELIAFTSSWHYRGHEIDTRKVAEELDVDYILYGTLRTSESGASSKPSVEITAHLVDAVRETTRKIESLRRPWDRPLLEAGVAARQIAQGVTDELLGLAALPPSADSCEQAGPDDTPLKARELCAQGRFQAHSQDFEAAIASLDEALDLQPDFVPARAALSWSYARAPFFSNKYRRSDTWQKAEEMARGVIETNPGRWEAHLALAVSLFYRDWKWQEAEEHYRQALALAPLAETDPRVWIAGYFSAAGRHEEALQQIEIANRRDMMSALVGGDYAWHLYHAGHFQEAVRQARRSVAIGSFDAWSNMCLLSSGLALDDSSLALEAIRNLLKARIDSLEEEDRRQAHAYLETLDALPPGQAVSRFLDWLEADFSRSEHSPPYRVAVLKARLGKREEMYQALGQSVRRKNFGPLFMAYEPAFTAYRQEKPFKELMEQVYGGLPSR